MIKLNLCRSRLQETQWKKQRVGSEVEQTFTQMPGAKETWFSSSPAKLEGLVNTVGFLVKAPKGINPQIKGKTAIAQFLQCIKKNPFKD